jgi:PAS domain S-box-containing protein
MAIISLTNHRYIDVNQQWLDAVGISREEVIGRTIDEVGVLSESQFQNILQTLVEHGKVQNHEVVYINRKGEERYVLLSTEIITINGERCLVAAAIDITERKKYDKEMARLDRLNLMGEIAGGIAHEIRNPMTGVRGYLQLFQEKEEFASYKKHFNTLIGELDRANAIITEFLSLARTAPPNFKKQSINSILTDLLPLIQADAAEHGIAISSSLSDTPEINLDEKQIRQLVLNLVRNGIEAMSRYGELTIKTRLKGNRVVLSIKDRGNGIPPDVLEKLGTPFFTTKEKGTGLGLPVCYRIAESHNARIEIKTGKRGTTFMVNFQVPSLQDEVNDI